MEGAETVYPNRAAAQGLSNTLATERPTMQKIINCPCGFVVTADTDDELVAKAQQHAKDVHQMELTRDQALAMARPA